MIRNVAAVIAGLVAFALSGGVLGMLYLRFIESPVVTTEPPATAISIACVGIPAFLGGLVVGAIAERRGALWAVATFALITVWAVFLFIACPGLWETVVSDGKTLFASAVRYALVFIALIAGSLLGRRLRERRRASPGA